jgi:glycosyltransferase involved in cell wall biosynthesis
MIRVAHVIGIQNGWAICNRAMNLARALARDVESVCPSFDDVAANGLPECDLVHVHGLQLVRLIAPRLVDAKVPWAVEIVSERSLKHLRKYRITADLLPLAAACWLKNPRLAGALQPFLSVEPAYVPNGVDTQLFQPRPVRIGWVGNKKSDQHADYKGLQFLDAAIKKLNAAVAAGRVRFEFVEAPGTYPHVVPQSELVPYYQSLDAYVSLSIAEGCSNTTNEALACGVPVVSTNVGIVPELVRDGAPITVVERDADSVAAGILEAVAGKVAACRTMDGYDWTSEQVAGFYLDEYRRLLQPRAVGV